MISSDFIHTGKNKYEGVIGLEVHAELATVSKMFCSCQVVDSIQAAPNVAVCPVCAGMPGVLPVVNQQAVEYGLRVALALDCTISHTSLFARKNYFYPDLPKGYQISQYEYPLAEHGKLVIETSQGQKEIRIRRVHLEEDTGKLTHVKNNGETYSLVDLNRAGVPLLEIVTEPDLHTVEEVRAYASGLRAIIRYLGVNSGDMEKGVIRFEANVSVRLAGSQTLGTRVEIKNLNSFRALERSVAYEIERQSAALERAETILQETLGWDEINGVTYSQRSKEEAHDYRYFPEPDLPPLVVEPEWIARVDRSLPELPRARAQRFRAGYGLSEADAALLVDDKAVADYFEESVKATPGIPPRHLAIWITGELFGWVNQSGQSIAQIKVSPAALGELVCITANGEINLTTAKAVLSKMLATGQPASSIIQAGGLQQISDGDQISQLVNQVLETNPQELGSYLNGKETLANWFFGQVMKAAKGKANPQVIRSELERQLTKRKTGQ
ncbi:MAG TPA: Asp-tRNA(Asn)/Glu-tRNA(Gln) amidotransferase subunit GatB [Anaerolineaceae bacterium]|nr:Asp-tRNA(Asn)/Glu-tRNA(Gln) amidotransferase subunit GatB [Anaerolineaceae bacterium]